jgi:hypothetical protein
VRDCCDTIKEAINTVEGKPRATSFEVTGDFNAADFVRALNSAGFRVKQ